MRFVVENLVSRWSNAKTDELAGNVPECSVVEDLGALRPVNRKCQQSLSRHLARQPLVEGRIVAAANGAAKLVPQLCIASPFTLSETNPVSLVVATPP